MDRATKLALTIAVLTFAVFWFMGGSVIKGRALRATCGYLETHAREFPDPLGKDAPEGLPEALDGCADTGYLPRIGLLPG